MSQARDNLCKLVTVTGHTKSGKTVLVRKVLPPEETVWVDGGAVGAEEDFWQIILNQLDLFQTTETGTSSESTAELSATGSAEASLLVVKGQAEIGGSLGTTLAKTGSRSRRVSSRVAALNGLRETKRGLIVDDFHYLPRDLQEKREKRGHSTFTGDFRERHT